MEEADRYLGSSRIADYCPNGLQVEGRPQVMRIVSGVTASQALLDAAVEAKADLVLVHHGYFWKGENPCITGMKQRRLKTLLKHDISLLAYHLPLDLHPEVGNNVQLARQLDITVEGPLDPENPKGRRPGGFPQRADDRAGLCPPGARGNGARAAADRRQRDDPSGRLVHRWRPGLHRPGGAGRRRPVPQWRSSEQTFHCARENDISFIAAGHHATERHGVQALGDYLARRFALEHLFIDCPNPI